MIRFFNIIKKGMYVDISENMNSNRKHLRIVDSVICLSIPWISCSSISWSFTNSCFNWTYQRRRICIFLLSVLQVFSKEGTLTKYKNLNQGHMIIMHQQVDRHTRDSVIYQLLRTFLSHIDKLIVLFSIQLNFSATSKKSTHQPFSITSTNLFYNLLSIPLNYSSTPKRRCLFKDLFPCNYQKLHIQSHIRSVILIGVLTPLHTQNTRSSRSRASSEPSILLQTRETSTLTWWRTFVRSDMMSQWVWKRMTTRSSEFHCPRHAISHRKIPFDEDIASPIRNQVSEGPVKSKLWKTATTISVFFSFADKWR